MMMSGKDILKSHVLSWRRKVYSDWEDVTSSGRAFHFQVGPATGKAQLPTVDRLTGMAPEDDGACLYRPSAGKLARAVPVSQIRRCTSVKNSEIECQHAGRSYIQSSPKRATSEEWQRVSYCDRKIAGERSRVQLQRLCLQAINDVLLVPEERMAMQTAVDGATLFR